MLIIKITKILKVRVINFKNNLINMDNKNN